MRRASGAKDPRIIRTKHLLTEALIDLSQDIKVDCITVSQLTDKAKLNRVTFYRHFDGMPDFLNQLLSDIFEDLQLPPDPPVFHSYEAAIAYYTRVFESVRKYERFFSSMMGRNGLPDFRQRFITKRQLWHKGIVRVSPGESDQKVDTELLTFSFITVLLSFIEYSLNHDHMDGSRHMAEQLVRLTHDRVLQHMRPLGNSL